MARRIIENQITDRTSVVDGQTGEILENREHTETSTKIIRSAEPAFIKIYIEDMLYMSDMPKSLTNLTFELAKRATFADAEDGLCVSLPKYIKDKICKACGWNDMRSLNNALTKLMKGKIITRVGGSGSGVYQLNPRLFGRGEWKDIERIRASWDYSIKGKTFMAEITRKGEQAEEIITTDDEDDGFCMPIPPALKPVESTTKDLQEEQGETA